MRALLMTAARRPLVADDVPAPEPGPGQVQLRVLACGVCRTDLHVLDGELSEPKLPLILGHEIVGRVTKVHADVTGLRVGQRVGVPWLGATCQHCAFCTVGQENLCDAARFTGYQLDGGYAEMAVAGARYCFPIPERYGDQEAAPLLCAGLIGYRALRMTDAAQRLGLYGYGAAAHIVAQIAVQRGCEVLAFTRPGDTQAQAFARRLGAVWAGDSTMPAPAPLDAAILFAPVGELVPTALRAIRKGGKVVCAGIHMSDIPSFPYAWLWEERSIRSVANLTRRDGSEFFAEIAHRPVTTETHGYALLDANRALDDLRHGRFQGAAVLIP